MAAGAESGFAHERVWAVEAVGQCEFMAVVDRDRGSVRLLHVVRHGRGQT